MTVGMSTAMTAKGRSTGGRGRARNLLLSMLPQNAIGMEIGVWQGNFSERLLQEVRPKTLHLVDPWKLVTDTEYAVAWYGPEKSNQDKLEAVYHSVLARFRKEIDASRVVVHRGKSAEILERLPPDYLDFVYIDGDHTYAGVTQDLGKAFRAVKPGGLICGDDYSLGQWWEDGVVRALHEFVATHPVIFQLLMGSQFVVRKLEGNLSGTPVE